MRPFTLLTTLAIVILPSTASAGTLFVNIAAPPGGNGLSWMTAFNDLQAALAEASDNPAVTDIWVAKGTYRPDRGTLDRDDSFALLSGVALYGGFAGGETDLDQRNPEASPTILSGDLKDNDQPGFASIAENSRHVVTAAGVDDTAVLDGFVISGGNADFNPDLLLGGGGLFVSDAGPTVRNCRFESNSAGRNAPNIGGFGGALYIDVGRPTIDHCTFADNRADNGGAVGVLTFSDDRAVITITACTFDSNTSEFGIGGAVYSAAGVFPPSDQTLAIRDCTFDSNSAAYAGAIADFNSLHLSITGTRFVRNAAGSTGVLWHAQTAGADIEPAVVRSCLLDSNQSADGTAGLLFEAANARIADSTFLNNRSATGTGGAVSSGPYTFGNGGELDVWNCLFSGNSASAGGALGTLRSTRVSVVSSTFSANIALSSGGGIAAFSPIEVANTVLWNNTGAGMADEAGQIFQDPNFGSLTIDFTDVQGLTGNLGGQGNIGADPLFTDADGPDNTPGTPDDDLTLTLESPAIDAADNARLPADALDLDSDGDTSEPLPLDFGGAPRRADIPGVPDTGNGQSPITDMGAHEAQPRTGCYADCTLDDTLDLFDFLCFVNLFNAGNPGADCDGNKTLDLFDFLCFVNAFNQGC